MRDRSNYPKPRPDPENLPFLEAWKQGRLDVQACESCDNRLIFPPRVHCPHCWSTQLRWETLSGAGKVVSFAVIHRPNHQAFFDEVPIHFAELALEGGVSMEARVLLEDGAELTTGTEVRLIEGSEAATFPLPTFVAVTG